MNFRKLYWLLVFNLGIFIVAISLQPASAYRLEQLQGGRVLLVNQQVVATPLPTISSPTPVTDATEIRVLPSVGSNAGLVIGASLLVLIIIGGVMISSRRKVKH